MNKMKRTVKIIAFILTLALFTLPVSAQANKFVWGDADGSGEVEITDVTCIQRHLVNLWSFDDISYKASMVENGKELSIADATLIQRYLVGLIDRFPVEDLQQDPIDQAADGIVVYFSCTDTTKRIAELIAKETGFDSYRIDPEVAYTTDDLNYTDRSSRTTIEQNDTSARPAIKGNIADISDYDVVFLGYPIWHGQAPRIISTFLDSTDLGGKTIIPFCTSASSGIGSSATNLHTLAPNAEWNMGRRFSSNTAKDTVKEWLEEMDILHEDTPITTMDVQVGDHHFTATLEENEAVSELVAMMKDSPITIDMSDYAGFEKVGSLGKSLTTSNSRITTVPGDIVLYNSDQIVMFYGSNTWSYTKLAHVDDLTNWETALGSGALTAVFSVR